MNTRYLIIDYDVVPDVFKKVIEAKKLIESGKYKSVNDVLLETNLSRTAFYKYKNHIFANDSVNTENIATLAFTLDDVPGLLSEILSVLANNGMNVLTINQNIPVNSVANITISFRIGENGIEMEEMIKNLKKIKGVNKVHLLAMSV